MCTALLLPLGRTMKMYHSSLFSTRSIEHASARIAFNGRLTSGRVRSKRWTNARATKTKGRRRAEGGGWKAEGRIEEEEESTALPPRRSLASSGGILVLLLCAPLRTGRVDNSTGSLPMKAK